MIMLAGACGLVVWLVSYLGLRGAWTGAQALQATGQALRR